MKTIYSYVGKSGDVTHRSGSRFTTEHNGDRRTRDWLVFDGVDVLFGFEEDEAVRLLAGHHSVHCAVVVAAPCDCGA